MPKGWQIKMDKNQIGYQWSNNGIEFKILGPDRKATEGIKPSKSEIIDAFTNKITWRRGNYNSAVVTGSIRQPTLVEIYNHALDDPELGAILRGCWTIGVNFMGEPLDPREHTSVELYKTDDLRRRLNDGYCK